jgi:dinuclear metal center YbgI/SA1388 family protein
VKVADVIGALQRIAPLHGAAEWDRVGLLVGSAEWEAREILLAVDLTRDVLEEALELGAGVVVAYHPPIFAPLTTVTDATPRGGVVLGAAAARVAVYSPHTALDAVPGGLGDWLAGCVGEGEVSALRPLESLPQSEQCKVVTFCPEDAADRLRQAMAEAGAGRIGRYTHCSFETAGTGTFLGEAGTHPAVGRAGRLEHLPEVRLEMVCSRDALGDVVGALRGAHPYEEPPIEIYSLQPRPQKRAGQGRRVVLQEKAALPDLLERIRRHLGAGRLEIGAGRGAPGLYGTIGLCAGAGGSLLEAAVRSGCELFLTGEMRHHDVLAAIEQGCTVVLAGHTATERGYLPVLRRRLLEALPGAAVTVSRRDAAPLRAM